MQYGAASGFRLGPAIRIGVFAAAIALGGGASAQPEDRGEFEVRTGTTELVEGVYYVDALIYLRLSTEVTEALQSKIPLTIRIEVQFLNRLRLWPDPVAQEVVQRYQLSYLPVIDRYVVHTLNVDQIKSFASLEDALRFIGEVDHLPVVDASLLDEDRRYDVRIRAALEKQSLTGPLRVFAWLIPDWSIESDWLEWRLDDE